ncbi:MAG: hypothetical protein PHI06_08975 [Desulfobulbaceae bacterium]|nr:hypothetical protein [Desulfobulbaceae bacterium]
MQKLLSSIQSDNRPINKAMVVAIASVLTCGTLLWLGALMTENKEGVEISSPENIVTDKTDNVPETSRPDRFEAEEQVIISHAPLATNTRQVAAYQNFAREISLATKALDSSNSRGNKIVQELTSVQACLTMTSRIAKDFFTGKNDAESLFRTETEEIDRITSNATDQAKQAIDRLQSALLLSEGIYTETHIAGPERMMTAGAPENEKNTTKLSQTISLRSSVGSGSAMISAAALARTVTRSAWSLLAKARQRATKRIAVAAFPAIVDGPLPLGDMLTIALESGCLLWSFHDVYHAQRTLKNDLEHELVWMMQQNSKHIRTWAMSVGNELMESAVQSTSR